MGEYTSVGRNILTTNRPISVFAGKQAVIRLFVREVASEEGRDAGVTTPKAMSFHPDKATALSIAADLAEAAGAGTLITRALRIEAKAAQIEPLSVGDFVRWTEPLPEHSKYANAVVAVTSISSDQATAFIVVPGKGWNTAMKVDRIALGNPLPVDDDGEKAIIG